MLNDIIPSPGQKPLQESEEFIKNSENFVGMGFYNIGNELKYIRDNKTYLQKGYSSFEDYVEKELDYARRSAYNFIEIAERYNVQSIAQVGHFGMTKLLSLARLDEPKREQFIQKNNVNEMSVRELKEAIKAKKEAESKAEEAERKAREAQENIDDLVSEVQRLNTQLSKASEPKVIEKTVEVEKIPEHIKSELQTAQLIAKQANQLKAENQNLKTQLEAAIADPERERIARESKASTFTFRINSFLHDMAALTYIGQEVISTTDYTRREYEKSLSQLEKWCREMRLALGRVGETQQIIDAEVI